MNRQKSLKNKIVVSILLFSLVFAELAALPQALKIQEARAWNPVSSIDITGEGDSLETDCFLSGECVPTVTKADVPRGKRNLAKNIITAILYGAGIALGQWLAKKINDKLQIRDFYGYDRSLKDMVYRYRILFDKYLDPDTRRLVDIGYDQVFNGGINYGRLYGDLVRMAQNQTNVPLPPITSLPRGGVFNLSYYEDPKVYAKLFAFNTSPSPEQIYFQIQEQALTLHSQAEQASSQELANAQGYKSTRKVGDLSQVWKDKDTTFYQAVLSPTFGQIQSPGAYAGRVVQVAVQRLLNRDYLNTNVAYAAIAEGSAWTFFKLMNGGIFKNSTSAIGNNAAGETFYANKAATTATNEEKGGNMPPDCNFEIDMNGNYTMFKNSQNEVTGECIHVPAP